MGKCNEGNCKIEISRRYFFKKEEDISIQRKGDISFQRKEDISIQRKEDISFQRKEDVTDDVQVPVHS